MMSTFKPLSTLLDKLPPERLVKIQAEADQISAAIRLAELRKKQQVTQTQLAERMHVSQASISQLESQGDVQLSTILRYVHALGGKLRIEVDMPDGSLTTLAAG